MLLQTSSGFKTDDSVITLNLSVHSNPRGNGFWKLNTSRVYKKMEENKHWKKNSILEKQQDNAIVIDKILLSILTSLKESSYSWVKVKVVVMKMKRILSTSSILK